MIDPVRMRAVLDGINAFGRSPETGGFNRPGFSDADMAARRWLADFMTDEGLDVSWDGAGNVFGRLGSADAPSVMLGSHVDTVPDGGAFDGALGVAVALECALAIRDAGGELAYSIEVVATAEEEGRFGGMLGSQAIAGLLTRNWLEQACDPDGVRLWDAMRRQGLNPEAALTAGRPPGSVKAFLELHVEQGPVLERTGMAVGIAERVSGVVNLSVSLQGIANHSGTTPMDMRADAFAGLAAIAAGVSGLIERYGSDQSRVTIGKVELYPNFPHTVPGRAEFSVIIRDTDERVINALMEALERLIHEEAGRHGVQYALRHHGRLPPAVLDLDLATLLQEEADSLKIDALVMPSGAGHDAQTMQTLCPSALIFVPSRGGISHAPDEWTEWSDACTGARLLLSAVTRLVTVRPAHG